jgi:sRNA-binding carbon storage regulator CsrA
MPAHPTHGVKAPRNIKIMKKSIEEKDVEDSEEEPEEKGEETELSH